MHEKRDVENLYLRLANNLRSAAITPNSGEDCKCLVKFHNCTPYNITPFWIDSKGLPIKYRSLSSGTSMSMDTYESHLWFFKASAGDDVKIIAIPEEKLPNPKSHLTSETKLSVSNPSYIYSCTTKTHRQDHSKRRRDIYLVEPFHNLRERCFLALRNMKPSDLTKLNLPQSLKEDFVSFNLTVV